MKFAQSSAVYYNYSLSYAISDLHRLGYSGIEVWGGRPHMYMHDLDEEIPELQRLLQCFSMDVCNFIPAQFRYPSVLCSCNERVRRDSIAYIKAAIDNAVEIGSPSTSLCPGMVLWNQDTGEGRRKLMKSFAEIGEYAEEKSMVLLIEPAHRFESNLILTVEDGLRAIDELKSDRFGILLDTGHAYLNGEDIRSMVTKCRGIPLHIHLDDNLGDADSHLLPGKGSIDFAALKESLRDIAYTGYLSVELGNAYTAQPQDACRKSMDFLQRKFA